MIICRTPYRISFFGGGTDYPAWFEEHGGTVLSSTINKYCYTMVGRLLPFFGISGRIYWGKVENVNSIDDIVNPVLRETLRFLNLEPKFDIHYHGDLPARAGLASSSAFCVGLINALRLLNGQTSSKMQLARDAIYVEQDLVRDVVGVQDQIAVAHGGLNHIAFHSGAKFEVTPLDLSFDMRARLEKHLILLFTGQTRISSQIAGEQIKSMSQRGSELYEMFSMVSEARKILHAEDGLLEFGKLLHESWMLKRSLTKNISNPLIDGVYETARANGAIGGKLLGAGGAGFMLFFAPPEKHADIVGAFPNFVQVDFGFENSGCQMIFDDSDHHHWRR